MTETNRLMCLNMWRLKPAGHIHKIQQLKLPFSCNVFFLPIKSKPLQKCFLWISSLHSIFLWCFIRLSPGGGPAMLRVRSENDTSAHMRIQHQTPPPPHHHINNDTSPHTLAAQTNDTSLPIHQQQPYMIQVCVCDVWRVCVLVIDYSTVADLKIEQETEMCKRSYSVFQIFGAVPK